MCIIVMVGCQVGEQSMHPVYVLQGLYVAILPAILAAVNKVSRLTIRVRVVILAAQQSATAAAIVFRQCTNMWIH